jgi:hypothetical protein
MFTSPYLYPKKLLHIYLANWVVKLYTRGSENDNDIGNGKEGLARPMEQPISSLQQP